MQITLLSEYRKKGGLAGKTMAARGLVNGRTRAIGVGGIARSA